MAKNRKTKSEPRPLIGLAAGLIAGLAASAAMEAFQTAASKAAQAGKPDAEQQDEEARQDDPTTVKAADAAAVAITGEKLPDPYRSPAGRGVHYATGALLGAVYGVITEYKPAAASGFGGAYGFATSLVLDEGVVPAAGLADAPWDAPLSSHGYSLASHLIYGLALEGTRALLGGRR